MKIKLAAMTTAAAAFALLPATQAGASTAPALKCSTVYEHRIAPVGNSGKTPITQITTEQLNCTPAFAGPVTVTLKVTGGTQKTVTVEWNVPVTGTVPFTKKLSLLSGQQGPGFYVSVNGTLPFQDLPKLTATG